MRSARSHLLLLSLGVIAALGCRLALGWFAFASTRDTSVVAVMALEIMDGARPMFYAGQAYMGALEAYIVACCFTKFGVSPFTLTFAPILFTLLWYVFTYLLFTHIFGRRGGLAAAFSLVCSGFYQLWYTTAAYCGYPETYCIGTICLYLALILRDKSGWLYWAGYVVLGALVALGLWVNLQIVPYLFIMWFVLIWRWWFVDRRELTRLAPFFIVAGIGILGFIPSLIISQQVAGNEYVTFSFAVIAGNLSLFLNTVLGRLVWWPEMTSPIVRGAVVACLGLPICVYFLTVRRERRRLVVWLPALFVICFLSLYLPHQLASKVAPRYVVASFSMLAAAGFAAIVSSPSRALVRCGWTMLLCWMAINVFFLGKYCKDHITYKAETLATRDRIVAMAAERDLRHIKILGGPADGLLGANFTFAADNRYKFLAAQDDRQMVAHFGWHQDNDAGYGYRRGLKDAVNNSISALMPAEIWRSPDDFLSLIGEMRPHHRKYHALPYIVVRQSGIQGDAQVLHDLDASTAITIPAKGREELVIRLPADVAIGGIRLLPAADDSPLPGSGYEIALSTDGNSFTPVAQGKIRLGSAYSSGNRIYLQDHYGAQDTYWPSRKARFLRLRYRPVAKGQQSRIGELLVFRDDGPALPVSQREIDTIQAMLSADKPSFVWADRYVSTVLAEKKAEAEKQLQVLPPLNLRFLATDVSRVIDVQKKQAVIVDNAMAQLCRRVISRSVGGDHFEEHRLDHYTVFLLQSAQKRAERIFWNGHMALAER